MTDSTSLIPFFDPEGVVVIGASQDPTKLGYGLANNLHRSGYKGAIHFVNLRVDPCLLCRITKACWTFLTRQT